MIACLYRSPHTGQCLTNVCPQIYQGEKASPWYNRHPVTDFGGFPAVSQWLYLTNIYTPAPARYQLITSLNPTFVMVYTMTAIFTRMLIPLTWYFAIFGAVFNKKTEIKLSLSNDCLEFRIFVVIGLHRTHCALNIFTFCKSYWVFSCDIGTSSDSGDTARVLGPYSLTFYV